ncbi:unnamed protein product [Sphenostylis stenocarpa]|uniref:Chorein N-terminal domain-containing protein n=1 Tax=Sphenostylis stenocarpa TaxID=92480 RepID=A0AA86VF04_9FABA|nr:unnamed protein product [Sphenostylis stenocarpa]
MFEGLVHQLLLGYLGRYFKDIQKEQLKIRLEEVLLENVELILDAFDYLQLPFALKQGRVGKLSIKIPWKKPWDPIIIILEDVFISASQRGDQEWSADAVEKREFAGKKAKLAAAELGKLSRRVADLGATVRLLPCDLTHGSRVQAQETAFLLLGLQSIPSLVNSWGGLSSDQSICSQAGQSFISHVTTKVSRTKLLPEWLDQSNQFTTGGDRKTGVESWFKLPAVHPQQLAMMKGASAMGVLVSLMGAIWSSNGGMRVGQGHKIVEVKGLEFYSRLFHGSMDLDNRLQKVDDNTPQYSVTAELSGVVISLDEIFWWHYAQQSVLSDVRRKLKKTSWRYFGDRL